MSLPYLLAPEGTPPFITDGHQYAERDQFSSVPRAAGHTRKRRVYTAAPRVVDVAWLLTAAQMQRVDAWYEDLLLAGERHFTARFFYRDAPPVFWDAAWLAPYTAEPIAGTQPVVWRVTGQLLLSGDASTTAPPTGPLTAAYAFKVTGAVSIASGADLAAEYVFAVTPDVPLTAEYAFDVGFFVVLPTYRLRQASDRRQRESGGNQLREAVDG